MQTFEPIFNKLQELFIDCFPDYVLKNNEEHNDGIIFNVFDKESFFMSSVKALPLHPVINH